MLKGLVGMVVGEEGGGEVVVAEADQRKGSEVAVERLDLQVGRARVE